MGLDQYGYATPDTGDLPDVDLKWCDDQGNNIRPRAKICQWRKHADLHRYFERLYFERGGTDPDFNCTTLRLTGTDIAILADVVQRDLLPKNEGGFFFGESLPEDKYLTLEFIIRAMEAINSGMAIYYDCWH